MRTIAQVVAIKGPIEIPFPLKEKESYYIEEYNAYDEETETTITLKDCNVIIHENSFAISEGLFILAKKGEVLFYLVE